jgi:hypothetical protein
VRFSKSSACVRRRFEWPVVTARIARWKYRDRSSSLRYPGWIFVSFRQALLAEHVELGVETHGRVRREHLRHQNGSAGRREVRRVVISVGLEPLPLAENRVRRG